MTCAPAAGFIGFAEALRLVHRPAVDADWQRAQDALRFREAFVLQAGLLRQRAELQATGAAPRAGKLSAEFEALPSP
ncbi:MAG: hypothetical protein R2717_09880 [Schumannella sp.]